MISRMLSHMLRRTSLFDTIKYFFEYFTFMSIYNHKYFFKNHNLEISLFHKWLSGRFYGLIVYLLSMKDILCPDLKYFHAMTYTHKRVIEDTSFSLIISKRTMQSKKENHIKERK